MCNNHIISILRLQFNVMNVLLNEKAICYNQSSIKPNVIYTLSYKTKRYEEKRKKNVNGLNLWHSKSYSLENGYSIR